MLLVQQQRRRSTSICGNDWTSATKTYCIVCFIQNAKLLSAVVVICGFGNSPENWKGQTLCITNIFKTSKFKKYNRTDIRIYIVLRIQFQFNRQLVKWRVWFRFNINTVFSNLGISVEYKTVQLRDRLIFIMENPVLVERIFISRPPIGLENRVALYLSESRK